MKKRAISIMLFIVFSILQAPLVQAQNQKIATERQIKDLLSRFYAVNDADHDSTTLARTALAVKELDPHLTENFTFAWGGGSKANKKDLFDLWQREFHSSDAYLWEAIKDKVDWEIVLEISDLQIEQGNDRADFKFKRVIYRQFTIRGEKSKTFRRSEHFTASGAAIRREGRWLLSSLQEVPVNFADYPKSDIDEAKKFDQTLEELIYTEMNSTMGKKLLKAKESLALQKELRQFFVDLSATLLSTNENKRDDSMKKFFTDDFNYKSNSLFDEKTMMLLGQETRSRHKIIMKRRNLQAFQNGETIVANYDAVYYQDDNGQKKLAGCERHQSVFVRRNGALQLMADDGHKVPDGDYFEVPEGWVALHGSPFKMGYDLNIKHGGEASVFLERDLPTGGVELRQIFQGKAFRGKRVQLTAFVKAEAVAGDADIFLTVDKEFASTDRLQNKGRVQGSSDWQAYTFTLDVPDDASFITISAILRGPGKIWLDDFSLKTVGKEVPVSEVVKRSDGDLPVSFFAGQYADTLMNLDFEDN
jgi:hypothetical protein